MFVAVGVAGMRATGRGSSAVVAMKVLESWPPWPSSTVTVTEVEPSAAASRTSTESVVSGTIEADVMTIFESGVLFGAARIGHGVDRLHDVEAAEDLAEQRVAEVEARAAARR